MDKSKKRHISYEALTLLGVIMLLCFITRLWPILLLALVGAIIAAIALLFVSLRKPETVAPAPPLPPPPMPENEGDLVRMAFTILERRITEAVLCQHPRARWVWETQNPEKAMHMGGPLFILLNHAGGFRRAQVVVADLQFMGLRYNTALPPDTRDETHKPVEAPSDGSNAQENGEAMPVNYELAAFEWVEDHIGYLSDQCNEAIACGDDRFVIPASVLPVRESWQAICTELKKNDFMDAQPQDDGIAIATPQYQE